jgi:hypothetical protein
VVPELINCKGGKLDVWKSQAVIFFTPIAVSDGVKETSDYQNTDICYFGFYIPT